MVIIRHRRCDSLYTPAIFQHEKSKNYFKNRFYSISFIFENIEICNFVNTPLFYKKFAMLKHLTLHNPFKRYTALNWILTFCGPFNTLSPFDPTPPLVEYHSNQQQVQSVIDHGLVPLNHQPYRCGRSFKPLVLLTSLPSYRTSDVIHLNIIMFWTKSHFRFVSYFERNHTFVLYFHKHNFLMSGPIYNDSNSITLFKYILHIQGLVSYTEKSGVGHQQPLSLPLLFLYLFSMPCSC